jgi:hypothetical protein
MERIPDEDLALLYASLMSEVKSRLQKLHLDINLQRIPSPHVEKVFRAEVCYLQLRRITEIVAVAVLLAHNPYQAFRNQDLS